MRARTQRDRSIPHRRIAIGSMIAQPSSCSLSRKVRWSVEKHPRRDAPSSLEELERREARERVRHLVDEKNADGDHDLLAKWKNVDAGGTFYDARCLKLAKLKLRPCP